MLLFAPSGHGKLLLPEGTHLIGSVVQAKPAGMFGHNGSLRLTFRKAELPAGDERVVHGRVIAAESVKNERVQIDNEGQIKASGGNRFLAPITLGSLAAVSDSTGAGLMQRSDDQQRARPADPGRGNGRLEWRTDQRICLLRSR